MAFKKNLLALYGVAAAIAIGVVYLAMRSSGQSYYPPPPGGGGGGSVYQLTIAVFATAGSIPIVVPAANVVLDGTKTGTTDQNGMITFQQVPPGSHALSVTASGYQPFTGSVNVTGNMTYNVTLF